MRLSRLTLALLVATAATASRAADPVLDRAGECVTTLTQFNEDRPWAQLTITREETVALVESAREDAIYVELGCSYDGNVYEGRRMQVPSRMRVTGKTGLPRQRYDARGLAAIVDAGDRQGNRGRDWTRIVVTALPGSSTNPLATVVYEGERSINLTPALAMTATRPPSDAELREAPPPAPTGARYEGSFLDDPVRALGYLEGAIGREPVQRVVFQPSMALVAYGPAANVTVRNWVVADGELLPQEPETHSPAAGPRCSRTPTLAEVRASATKLMADAAKAASIKRSVMLLMQCEAAGKPPRWELLGGDGVLKEGQALKQEYFPL